VGGFEKAGTRHALKRRGRRQRRQQESAQHLSVESQIKRPKIFLLTWIPWEVGERFAFVEFRFVEKEKPCGGQAGMAAWVRQPDRGESTLFRASSTAPQKLPAI
jgi:hypothetical protein